MRANRGRTSPELPCVWVTAGVLSYRPCDREYECEDCPLYLALRGDPAGAAAAAGREPLLPGASGEDDAVGHFLAELGAGCTLHLDRAYSTDGMWLDPNADGDVRVGLDDYTLRLLQPLDDVVLPRLGVWLQHAAPCAWLNRGRLAIALRTPVAGEVVAVHPHPTLAPPGDAEPDNERWWFRLRPHESLAAAAGLRRNEALLRWFLERVRTVRGQLDAAMAPAAQQVAGPLRNDGGLPARDLEAVLGRERFEALVGTLFPVQI
jgi:glycine cleavage system H lipoate-binding protein